MSMRANLRWIGIFALLVFLLGCPRPPLRFGFQGMYTDAHALLQEVDRQSSKLFSVNTEARVRLKTPEQSGTADHFIAAQKNALLHFETLSFFGKPVAVWASNEDQFGLYLDEEGVFYTGPATAKNFSLVFPLEIEPSEIVRLLLGDVPRIQYTKVSLSLDEEARAYLITLTQGEVTQRLWIETEFLRPVRSEIRGKRGYNLHFNRYRDFQSIRLPTTIKLSAVEADGQPGETELTVRYTGETEVNTNLERELFVPSAPPNARIVTLDR